MNFGEFTRALIKSREDQIALMKAYLEGHTIDSRNRTDPNSVWTPDFAPSWNFCEFEYRVYKNIFENSYEIRDLL